MTRHTPVVAFANCSLDSDKSYKANSNGAIHGRVTKDAPKAVEMVVTASGEATFDVAPRRLRRFRPAKGRALAWTAENTPTRRDPKPEPQSGTAVVDKDGVIVLTGLKINRESTLTVRIAPEG